MFSARRDHPAELTIDFGFPEAARFTSESDNNTLNVIMTNGIPRRRLWQDQN